LSEDRPFQIIALAASAGGLNALSRILGGGVPE
jgi:chemotaxis response regulator CheB